MHKSRSDHSDDWMIAKFIKLDINNITDFIIQYSNNITMFN